MQRHPNCPLNNPSISSTPSSDDRDTSSREGMFRADPGGAEIINCNVRGCSGQWYKGQIVPCEFRGGEE